MAKDAHAVVERSEPDIGLLRDLVASSPQVIYVYDQIGHRFDYLSENLTAITGHTAQSLNDADASVLAFVHPDDLEKVRVHVGNMFRSAGDEAVSVTFRFRHAEGHWVWVKAVDRVLDCNSDGRVHRTVGHAHEVTEMLETQRAFERSNRANAFLLNSSRILADVNAHHKETLQQLAEYASEFFDAVCEVTVVRPSEDIISPLVMFHSDRHVRNEIMEAYSSQTLRVGQGMVGRVIGEGLEMCERSVSPEFKRKIAEYSPRLVPEGFIYVPLLTGRGVLGAMNFIRLDGSEPFDEDDFSLIRKLTEHTALFLDNAWMREDQLHELALRRETQEQLERANEVSAFLLRVSRLLSDLQSGRQQVLDKVTEEVAAHFGVFCVVYMMNADGVGLLPRSFFHEEPEVRKALKRVFHDAHAENGLRMARHVTRSSQPVIINDAWQQHDGQVIMDPVLTPRAYGFWPLKWREQIGAICLCRLRKDETFSPDELARGGQLAAHLSLFLENMLLHERQEEEIERRRAAEERLARNESDLRNILDAIPINIARVSKDLHYRFLNSTYRKMGIDPYDMVGSHIRCLLGEQGLRHIQPRIDRVLQGEMLNYDEQVILANGRRRHFNVVIAPDYDEHGNIEGFYSCTVDVSEKMEAERELRISEERYRSLLLNSGDAFCLHRFSGEILDANSFATEMLGYSRDELIGMNINRVDHGWLSSEYPQRLARVSPDTPITFDTVIYHKNGNAIPVEVRFVKRIEDGEVLIQALARDRTEKFEREERLRQSEERMRVLIQNVDDVILTLGYDGNIRTINNPKQGATREEVIGSSIYDSMTDEVADGVRSRLQEARESGIPFDVMSRYKGPDGTTEWYLTKYCPINGSDMLVSVSRNITHLKESELQVMNGMTLGQEQERRRLGAELHDGVGQILSSIALELSQMRQTNSCNEEMQLMMKELASRVSEAINEVRNISHDLMPGVLESFGLADAIRQVCRSTEERSGIRFYFDAVDMGEKYPPQMETHLYRMAQELISNAVKHSYCQQVHVNLIDHGDVVSLSVEDDGIGMKVDLPHSGIGLSNVRSRSSILGGTLSVESSATSGTLVQIEVPNPI